MRSALDTGPGRTRVDSVPESGQRGHALHKARCVPIGDLPVVSAGKLWSVAIGLCNNFRVLHRIADSGPSPRRLRDYLIVRCMFVKYC
jgi:hypothetical protein